MGEKLTAVKSERLVSLDVFRGITIAGMILVNHPGSWSNKYAPLGHAAWHGWTPTDLVFPFFLFIVGVAMTFSFDRRLAQGQSRLRLFEQVVRRTLILYFIGLIMYGFPDWRLIGPYVLFIIGLGFLFADEPPLGWPQAGKPRARKVAGWILLVGAVLYFILDFRYFNESNLRVVGVLQRIALCYFFASLVVMYSGVRGRVLWAAAFIIGYWVIMKLVQPPAEYIEMIRAAERALAENPDAWKTDPAVALYRHSINVLHNRPSGLLPDWLDIKLLGMHLYRERPDPEGLLSTLPAIGTTLLGVLTGNWLHTSRERNEKAAGLFWMANIALFVGLCMDYWFPINKKIWTSSYVVFTVGMGLHFLAMCFWLIDVKGYKKWSWPFRVFGTNAIVVYFAAHLGSKMLGRWRIPLEEGGTTSAYSWIYQNVFASWADPVNASLLFAITYVLVWLLLLIPLYRKKVFVKI